MKNILVLTDFSENSVNAYRYAVQMACQVNANILLVFSTNGKEISLTNQMQYSQMLHSFAKRHACAGRMQTNPNHTECLISGDSWSDVLPLLIQVHKPGLVVAGSELLSQLEKEQASLPLQAFINCPIVWVPEKATYVPLKELVFVTDFTDQDNNVIMQVKEMATQFSASVTLLHFHRKEDRNRLAELKRKAIALQAEFENLPTRYFLIEEEEMMEGLEDFAQRYPADLFLLATRDTHLAHQYFQPEYRKTNSCQTSVPLLNLYQQKRKACSGNCTNCQKIKKLAVAAAS